MKPNTLNRILYACILIALFIPLGKLIFIGSKERPLQGYITNQDTIQPVLNLNDWMSGLYQDRMNKWVKNSFGLHNFSVRARNQIAWNLYDFSYTNNVTRGKDDYLYDIKYIHAWNGKDFLGIDTIRERVSRMKLLQDRLHEAGIAFLVVMAPGKASYFPEHLTDDEYNVIGPTNYGCYKEQFAKQGVNTIDFRGWFDQLKSVSQYPLFPQCGIHWSQYGALIAADSLIKYVRDQTQMPMESFRLKSISMSDSLYGSDYDIGASLNLIWDLKAFPMAKADFEAPDAKSADRPRALVIADSYFWTMPLGEMRISAFRDIEFLYYNREFHPSSAGKMKPADKINYKTVVGHNDIVILLCTDSNLPEFPWGFVDQTLLWTGDSAMNKKIVREAHIRDIMEGIKADANWFGNVQKSAAERNISVDSCLYLNAAYVFDELRQSPVR
jgi:SGNH hydrolase-like domain, acetyltransferase AlgX